MTHSPSAHESRRRRLDRRPPRIRIRQARLTTRPFPDRSGARRCRPHAESISCPSRQTVSTQAALFGFALGFDAHRGVRQRLETSQRNRPTGDLTDPVRSDAHRSRAVSICASSRLSTSASCELISSCAESSAASSMSPEVCWRSSLSELRSPASALRSASRRRMSTCRNFRIASLRPIIFTLRLEPHRDAGALGRPTLRPRAFLKVPLTCPPSPSTTVRRRDM